MAFAVPDGLKGLRDRALLYSPVRRTQIRNSRRISKVEFFASTRRVLTNS
jgi:hypothetical protein